MVLKVTHLLSFRHVFPVAALHVITFAAEVKQKLTGVMKLLDPLIIWIIGGWEMLSHSC